MRIKPTVLERLSLALAGEPTDTRRQTTHVEDRRGEHLSVAQRKALAAELVKSRKKMRPPLRTDPDKRRELLGELSRMHRDVWGD